MDQPRMMMCFFWIYLDIVNDSDQIADGLTDLRIHCGDAGVTPGEIDLADYTRSIERLNTSLGFLQTEMQRLAQQQEKIMAMREQQQQAWVIPPPAPSPHRYHPMIDINE